jgi:5-hydroxyisourate hydrolase
MSILTTHVLDTSRGNRPAESRSRSRSDRRTEAGSGWTGERRTRTAAPGCSATKRPIPRGVYRLSFDTAAYFSALNVEGFYPEVIVTFEVRDPSQHYHVPLLLARYGYSTYRGS